MRRGRFSGTAASGDAARTPSCATLERYGARDAGAVIGADGIRRRDCQTLMDRYLTAEHIALRERVNAFGRERIEPVAREIDETGVFHRGPAEFD